MEPRSEEGAHSKREPVPPGSRCCPRDGQRLKLDVLAGVEVDVCRACQGVWLDRGELEEIAPGFVRRELRGATRPVPRAVAARVCPACRGDLVPQYYGRGLRRIELDFCLGCSGMWVDLAPLRNLGQRARAALKRRRPSAATADESTAFGLPRRAREWFVALTGMPLDVGNPCSIVPWATWGLILLNVATFVYELLLGARGYEAFVTTYALVPERLADGEYYRLATCMFLHLNLFHLAGNLFFLHTFGDNLEERYGAVGYLLMYFSCGLIAGAASSWLGAAETADVPRIGASGAVSGVLGAYLVTFPRTRILVGFLLLRIIPWVLHVPVWAFLVFWVGLNAVGLMIQPPERYAVDYVAHLGGFGAGLVAGLVLVAAHDLALKGVRPQPRISPGGSGNP